MSATAVVWLSLFIGLSLMSRVRPVYGCVAYLMTFFTCPPFWWWGKGVLSSITMRWSLVGAGVVVIVMLLNWGRRPILRQNEKAFFVLLGLYVLNAVVVHFNAAANPVASLNYLDVLWKSAALTYCIRMCLVDEEDLHIFLFAIVCLCGYIGYEVVINDAGRMEHGRLEGIGIPNASGANGNATVLSLGLVLAGYFVIAGRNNLMRVASFLMAPFILDTVLRCNSRGAYLGLIGSGACMLILSTGPVKRRAVLLIALGVAAILIQAGNETIWTRFYSTFASDERDNAASERLLYWESALKMIADYPLGKGGKAAFASELGSRYIAHFRPNEFRSVHNGFLDLMAGWGIQGFLLFMSMFGVAFVAMYRVSRQFARVGNYRTAFLGAALCAVVADQFICTVFTSVLDGEWYLWLAACCLTYSRLPVESPQESEQASETLESP